MALKEIYEIGEMPPLGVIPKQMYAQVIRQDRFGQPMTAFQVEKVEIPSIGPDEVLVYVIAADVKNVKVGDHVVAHCGVWDRNDPWVKAGKDPILAASNKIWGYET